jgi:hypothetical protein
MGRKPKKSRTPQATHTITVKVTGAEKNLLIRAAEEVGMSLSDFMSWTVFEYCQSQKGIPPAPAPYPRPTPADFLHSYLSGDRVLMPCGKEECDMKIVEFDNAQFCRTCSFRVF